MPTEPAPATLSALVRRAAYIVDPDDEDAAVGAFEERHEDDDEPVRGILEELEERIAWGVDEEPSVVMAQALVLYLAHRRDEVDGRPEELMRLAARAEFDGRPPQAVEIWLSEQEIEF